MELGKAEGIAEEYYRLRDDIYDHDPFDTPIDPSIGEHGEATPRERFDEISHRLKELPCYSMRPHYDRKHGASLNSYSAFFTFPQENVDRELTLALKYDYDVNTSTLIYVSARWSMPDAKGLTMTIQDESLHCRDILNAPGGETSEHTNKMLTMLETSVSATEMSHQVQPV